MKEFSTHLLARFHSHIEDIVISIGFSSLFPCMFYRLFFLRNAKSILTGNL